MVDHDEIRALATGMPPAPARIVLLDSACEIEGLDAPAAALAEAQDGGCRATLRLCGLTAQTDTAILLNALGEKLEQEGRKLGPEGLALSAARVHPEEAALGAVSACAGSPATYLLLPPSALEAIQRRRPLKVGENQEIDARRWWGGLLGLAASAPSVSLVPEAPGRGLSTLASAHRWLGPSPGAGELIPAAPSRLRLKLDFGALINASGDRLRVLSRLGGRIVLAADEMLGQALGSGGPRRLALELEGIARAVTARGYDPRSFGALKWARSRLWAFRDGARAASVQLARTRGAGGGLQPFPLPEALEVADADHLDRAMLVHGARHSHLVCVSPWSLAPPGWGRDGLNLLPALACADSIAWRRPETECAPEFYCESLRFAWAVALRS